MSTLFLEIRCEELPARFVEPAIEGLKQRLTETLKGLYTGPVHTWATPRRLAVSIEELVTETPREEQLVTGPPEAAAFRDGAPTKAAEGFARSKGLAASDLEIVEGPKGRVIAARVTTGGDKTADLLQKELDNVVLGVKLQKTMRWGTGAVRWGRPIHGVVCLIDQDVVPAEVAGVPAGRTTLGHRQSPEPFAVVDTAGWLDQCRQHHVEPDSQARRDSILEQMANLEADHGFDVVKDKALLDEVVDLVEWPVAIVGTFAEGLLDLPSRLLEESMRVHTRTFPTTRDGELTNQFIVIHNNPTGDSTVIAEGNARVMDARFHDAKFFFAEDKKQSLEDHGQGLAEMQWLRKGGSMAEKQHRVAALSANLAPSLGAELDAAHRAASLCKCDLLTQMVGEFPELQGHVGRLLAEQHETAAVALAIEEHYLPRFAGDVLPTSVEGTVVALADRIDTLAHCFALGLAPKGSADPLGLRRAAIGLIALLIHAELDEPLTGLLARDGVHDEALVGFVLARLRATLMESHPTEVVDAVLATGDNNVLALARRADAMGALAQSPAFAPLRETFKRVVGLTKEHNDTNVDPDLFTDKEERLLHQSFVEVRDTAAAHCKALRYDEALETLRSLKDPVDNLFDGVLVMSEDRNLRHNRLCLLRAIANEFARIADFKKL